MNRVDIHSKDVSDGLNEFILFLFTRIYQYNVKGHFPPFLFCDIIDANSHKDDSMMWNYAHLCWITHFYAAFASILRLMDTNLLEKNRMLIVFIKNESFLCTERKKKDIWLSYRCSCKVHVILNQSFFLEQSSWYSIFRTQIDFECDRSLNMS